MGAPQNSTVVQMKRGRGPDHVLFLPGLGGSVLPLVWLARAYPGPETIVGLELAATGSSLPRMRSVTELASSHLSALIHAGAAGGRWHLVGHCLGATVAMEMAHQLARSGERLGAVVLLEPFLRLSGALEDEERRRAGARQRAADRLSTLLERTPAPDAAVLADDPAVREDLGELDLDPGLLSFGMGFALSALAHIGLALPAYLAHEPRPISVPVHLLLAQNGHRDIPRVKRRLRQLTSGVTLHQLACPHADLLRQPHAAVVAARIASLTAN